MFPDLEFIKTCLNGLRSRIEKVEDWAVSEDQVAQAVADYFAKNPIIESDPTVPAWAKEPTKPTYTAREIGAQPVKNGLWPWCRLVQNTLAIH